VINKWYDALKKFIKKLFLKECLYIHSSNALPPPLDSEKEKELLELVEHGDMEARNTLIVHNLRLVVFIAKKFESTKINIEDLVSIGSMGLIKAVGTFKLDKNIKLATYASRCIENEILMYLRKTQKSRLVVSLDEVLSVDAEGNEMMLFDVLGDNSPSSLTRLLECESEENLYKAFASYILQASQPVFF
jgi:RNA polymerase sporulation-specific sigma factor